MGKFSSQEIEFQYNLIKTLLSDPEKYKDAIDAVKKEISYMPVELKKKLEDENITFLSYNYPPVQKRTESAVGEPVALISSTHSLKKFDSFFNEQKPRAIATNATADTTFEPN